ncbi:protein kinase family protein, partial [Streptomyces alkaliphilus]|uniref:protein kinase family protein n=1 Tax=Streptomyces alkaliphilus TaxID=1472722 RepID=UPI00188938DD
MGETTVDPAHPADPRPGHRERLVAHRTAATALTSCGDTELAALVAAAKPLGTGIGGRSALLEIDGVPVFVKRIPLTDTELRPENLRSTADLFDLPAFCHYGAGGPGFGAWRELAAHVMTHRWVLTGDDPRFPLLHHWRVLPEPAPPLPEELADIDRTVARWGGAPGVRHRLEEMATAGASLVLFLEYVPQDLHRWLGDRVREGGDIADEACLMVERELLTGTLAMNARGLLHFDTHFGNVLTDGRRLHFTDHGLSLSSRFRLSPEHARFLDQHRDHDPCYAMSYLVNRLLWMFSGLGVRDAAEVVRACAGGARPEGLSDAVAGIVTRHAPVTLVMTDFVLRMLDDPAGTPYPADELRRLSAERPP